MLKVSESGKVDCLHEGLTLMRGAGSLVHKMLAYDAPITTDLDWQNLLELGVVITSRCNYVATVEGLVVSHMLHTLVTKGTEAWWKKVLGWLVFGTEVLINLFDDVIVIAMAAASFWQNFDLYNPSIVMGKILKLMFQLYLEGFLFKK